MSYVVCVTFQIKKSCMQDFMPLIHAQAQNSLMLEPDCIVFDVCCAEAGAEVFLYEIYTDTQAFQTHLSSTHFREFDAAVADMVQAKSIATYLKEQA